MKKICIKKRCNNFTVGRGLCRKHYEAERRVSKTQFCSVEDCGVGVTNSRGWCDKHYKKWLKYGDPLGFTPLGRDPRPADIKFWEKVNKDGRTMPHMTTPCWEWAGSANSSGYGTLTYKNKTYASHRFAWFLDKGGLPKKHLLHHCDNPACIRLTHLYEGTPLDNARDREQRKRGLHHRDPQEFIKRIAIGKLKAQELAK